MHFTAQFRTTITGRLAGTPLAAHAHAIAAGLGAPNSGGVQSGLTAAARQAAVEPIRHDPAPADPKESR